MPSAPPSRASRWRGFALAAALCFGALWLLYPLALRRLAGAWRPVPGSLEASLGSEARALLSRALEGLDQARLVDLHAHLAGLGTDDSGCEIDPRFESLWHPLERVRFDAYLSASGVRDRRHADREYVQVLADLVGQLGGRAVLLAFDRHHDASGRALADASPFHVPNDWAQSAVERHPGRFLLGASVHPYRPDALPELERVAALGAKLVKWLPNAQGMDPSDPRLDDFYQRLVQLDLVLLCHTGDEQAVPARAAQELGNPLLLRRPLDAGVRVVAAHCASLGVAVDLDHPERPLVPAIELFLRLMDEPRYEGLFFGDLSALAIRNRDPRALEALLARTDLHARLLYGSDWPLPGIAVSIDLARLCRRGLLRPEEEAPLRELYRLHPLAFCLALLRSLRLPGSERGFADEAFLVPAAWGW